MSNQEPSEQYFLAAAMARVRVRKSVHAVPEGMMGVDIWADDNDGKPLLITVSRAQALAEMRKRTEITVSDDEAREVYAALHRVEWSDCLGEYVEVNTFAKVLSSWLRKRAESEASE